jgi:cytidyltransferase-like protein
MSYVNRCILLSGGFDPLHVGHVRMILAAKAIRSNVTIALNSDDWLIRKKGFAFMPWKERAEILRALHVCVVQVDDRDGTVCEALERLQPSYFANGGDRTTPNEKEHETCRRLGIKEVFGVGGGKVQSSSELVRGHYAHALPG